MSVILIVLGLYFTMNTLVTILWTYPHVKDGTIFDPMVMALFPTVPAVLALICFWNAYVLW